jgi:small subunit ribosomal protein S16
LPNYLITQLLHIGDKLRRIMLRIRLTRTGKKRQPSYRIVVADKRSRRDGRVVERIGFYNPLPDPIEYRIQEARALHWLSVGAQPTDAVRRLLEKQGTLSRLERVHLGEDIATLVAEYEGVDPVAMAQVDALEVESAVTEEE